MNKVFYKEIKKYFSFNSKGQLFSTKSGSKRKVGYICSNGYIGVSFNGKTLYAHRIIFFLVHGYLPEQIDHANRIRKDNRIINLLPSNNFKNQLNLPKKKVNKSGVSGLHFNPKEKRWRVQLRRYGVRYDVGSFKFKKDAVKALTNFNKTKEGVKKWQKRKK